MWPVGLLEFSVDRPHYPSFRIDPGIGENHVSTRPRRPGTVCRSFGSPHSSALKTSGHPTAPLSSWVEPCGDPGIMERFLDLAGGPDAPIVVIPTAGGDDEYDQFYQGLNSWRDVGATNLKVLHTKDRGGSRLQRVRKGHPRSQRGVVSPVGVSGGWPTPISETKTEEELWNLLERGGVIGGSSAGATIQGSYLARGDTDTNTIMMGDHEEGFGFLRNTAIDQHVLRRNRQFDLIELIRAPHRAAGHRDRRRHGHRGKG